MPKRSGAMSITTRLGAAMLAVIAGACFLTLPWSTGWIGDRDNDGKADFAASRQSLGDQYLAPGQTRETPAAEARDAAEAGDKAEAGDEAAPAPQRFAWGSDALGRSLLWRCLLGGAVSLGIGIAAASIAVVIGVTWGAVAGYLGGAWDGVMMRIVDVLIGLPYLLLVVLIDFSLDGPMEAGLGWIESQWTGKEPGAVSSTASSLLTLLLAIGSLSWLTMSRVVRGQVLSLRSRPFVEAARAAGAGPWRILRRHLAPNLVGVIVVYATLTVPIAILQESFLSFLGIGVEEPLPSWGLLAADGAKQLPALVSPSLNFNWWLPVFPCVLLG
ncbi:MAG: ABC transporter permease, partial [Planctomycetota bacterium]